MNQRGKIYMSECIGWEVVNADSLEDLKGRKILSSTYLLTHQNLYQRSISDVSNSATIDLAMISSNIWAVSLHLNDLWHYLYLALRMKHGSTWC